MLGLGQEGQLGAGDAQAGGGQGEDESRPSQMAQCYHVLGRHVGEGAEHTSSD